MIAMFDHRVRHDLDEAFDWLEKQQTGLSLELRLDLQRLMVSVKSDPLQFGPWLGTRHQDQIRAGKIGRFRYVLIFKVMVERGLVLVLSAQHGHLRPGAWKARLKTFRPEGE